MIRFVGIVALGALVAASLVLATAVMHLRVGPRATRASPLQAHGATPATPLAVGPYEAPGAVPVSLTIQNTGPGDRLVGARAPVAKRVELHRTRLIDGQRAMIPAPDGIPIPAGETLLFEPAAHHLMLVGLGAELVQGEAFPMTLLFEDAGEATVAVRVRRRVDAAGVAQLPAVVAGDLRISLASAPPAPAATATP